MRIVHRNGIAIAAIVVCLGACLPRPRKLPRPEPELLHFTTNGVEVVVRASASVIRLDEDLFVTVATRTPAERDLSIPPAVEFVEGFDVRGEFDELPVTEAGMTTQRRRLQLRPRIAAHYRVGPIPVRFVDYSRNPAASGALVVPAPPVPVVLPVAPPPADIVVVFHPMGPGRSWAPLARRAASGLIACLAVVLAGLYMRTKMRQVGVPLSSREAALRELRELMRCELLSKGRVDEFYRSLADIVRRYIERTHAIAAPEKTTEELLSAVAKDSRFDAAFTEPLARFLREADFVKFAARCPDRGTVAEEIGLAERIIGDE